MEKTINFWEKQKWQEKYLKQAEALAEDVTDCYSRKVGCVIVSEDNTIVSLGYNGPFRGCPLPDSEEYLGGLISRISDDEKEVLRGRANAKFKNIKGSDTKLMGVKQMNRTGKEIEICQMTRKSNVWDHVDDKGWVIGTYDEPNLSDHKIALCFEGCKTCPRRLLDIPSGQGREKCPCACAERNALNNANRSGASTLGAIAFVTTYPCYSCSVELIQAGIQCVVYRKSNEGYIDENSKEFFRLSGISVLGIPS